MTRGHSLTTYFMSQRCIFWPNSIPIYADFFLQTSNIAVMYNTGGPRYLWTFYLRLRLRKYTKPKLNRGFLIELGIKFY